eukprot:COSAG02_NODE_646_length_18945_cov_17.654462_7_plen_61_part_00
MKTKLGKLQERVDTLKAKKASWRGCPSMLEQQAARSSPAVSPFHSPTHQNDPLTRRPGRC